ncbi:Ig-like domain-containing protein, partial [Winogradskyella sp.]|uniref:Ig-like domain-containing protein n=1 Tax=Winogradskyella sp. TaxID=1883156 RepID=UPI003AB5D18F
MNIKKHLVLILILAFVSSCKKKPVETDNIFKFRDYISYTTSGLVSVTDPIKITLSDTVSGWEIDKTLPTDLIKLTPHVQGQLKAMNNHTLLFTPDESLEPATEYTVNVKLGEIYNTIPKDFEDYTFQFKTITPSFNITTQNLQSYSKEWQYMFAQLRSADVISLNEAKKLVTASQNSKSLNLVWNEANETSKFFEFKIDSINRLVEDSKIDIAWDGSAIKADNKGENFITIPGKNNFTIVTTEVVQSPEQFLSLNFSDPLVKQQNFAGLVSLQGVKNPKYIVDGNVLRVYPDTKLVGDIQVDVFKGIKNTDGFKLKTPFSELVTFEELKPEVRLISNGSILPNSKELKFNFEAVNLSKVDVRIIKIFEDNVLQFLQDYNLNSGDQYAIKKVGRRIAKETITLIQEENQNTGKWKAYSIDLSKYLKADPGAIYRVELSFKKEYSLYDCTSNAETTTVDEDDYYDDYYEEDYYASEDLSEEEEDLREERYWDNLTYSYRNTNYRWRDRDNPCTDSYFNYGNRVVSQNLISSNLGIIAKQGADNTYLFAITNILSTSPESGAKVTLYNYQQQELANGITNKDGIIKIDAKHRAAFAIATKGSSVSYI